MFNLLLVLGLGVLLVGCSITRAKWRIKFDRTKARAKASFLSSPPASTKAGRPRKVVVLLADDLRQCEVSADVAEHVSIPHIDRIGAAVVVFKEGCVTSPTCAPFRAGIMTGRVQNRYEFESHIMEHYPTSRVEYISGRSLVDTGEFVVKAKTSFPAEWQAHKQGYTTGLVGKWHLGGLPQEGAARSGLRLPVRVQCVFALHSGAQLASRRQPRARVFQRAASMEHGVPRRSGDPRKRKATFSEADGSFDGQVNSFELPINAG